MLCSTFSWPDRRVDVLVEAFWNPMVQVKGHLINLYNYIIQYKPMRCNLLYTRYIWKTLCFGDNNNQSLQVIRIEFFSIKVLIAYYFLRKIYTYIKTIHKNFRFVASFCPTFLLIYISFVEMWLLPTRQGEDIKPIFNTYA